MAGRTIFGGVEFRRLFVFVMGMGVLLVALVPLLRETRLGISLITASLVVISSCWAYVNIHRSGISLSHFGVQKPTWSRVILFFVCFTVAVYLVGLLFKSALPVESEALRQDILPWPIVMFYFVLSIPLQEFVFRGYVLTTILGSRRSIWLAIGLSTVVYSIFHIHYGSFMVLAAVPLGIVFGSIRVYSKSLIYPVIGHWVVGLMFYYLI